MREKPDLRIPRCVLSGLLPCLAVLSAGAAFAQSDSSTQPAGLPVATQPAGLYASTQPANQPSTQPASQPSTQPASQPSTRPTKIRWDSGTKMPSWLDDVAAQSWNVNNGEMPKTKPPPVRLIDWDKPLPVAFRAEFGVASDYVWRGINFTPQTGGRGEIPTYQSGVAAEVDTGPVGIFGASVWFDWWRGLDSASPAIPWENGGGGGETLENDYTIFWRYPILKTGIVAEAGWDALRFPRANGDLRHTYELYTRWSFDDSRLWGKYQIFNPYIFYATDFEAADHGTWAEIGLKPRWAFADLPGLKDMPAVKEFWVSPTLSLGIDSRYLNKIVEVGEPATRLANLVYGLDVGYDLGHLLRMPPKYGTLTLIGFLNYSQAFRTDLLNDQLWGGFKVAYSW